MEAYQMKPSGVEWLGDVPEHWKVDRIKDIARLRSEKTSIKSEQQDYLELEDISQWTGKILYKRDTLEVESQVNLFYEGDVLFGKLRPYLAKCVFATFDGKCTGEILAINPIKSMGVFLAYYMRSKHFINHCNNFSYGAKMPRVNWITQLGVFPIPVPPMREQHVIANYLDQACKTIDQTIAVKKKQLEKLDAYRKSVIHEAVTKGLDQDVAMKPSGVEWLGDIPEHWITTKIKNKFFLKPSNVDKKSHDDEFPVELCNYVDVYYNDYITNDIDFMKATANQHEINKFSLVLDDVILTKDSEDPMDIGVPALVNEIKTHLVCGYHLTMLRKRPCRVSGAFLFWSLKDEAIASQFYREATGVTRWAISSRNIKNLSFTFPPLSEQRAIANHLDQACNTIDQSKQVIEKQVAKLTEYRKSLIHECVTGKKRIYQGEV